MSPKSSLGDESVSRALPAFENDHPDYARTHRVDDLRRQDFARLDELGHTYLDYTGGSLYSQWQIREHMKLLEHGVFGNPHSANPSSLVTTGLVEASRRHVLDFFRASPEEYVVVFTANASAALKLVGESYPFEPGDRYLLTFDNHNSVNGIREYDRVRGAETTYVPLRPPEMRVDERALLEALDIAEPGRHNLFAYPAQSNFSGVQHPLAWIELAQSKGWDVLLDAAAFVPSNRLDLSRWHPDFVALSFYKMFGYPTGVGALVARREALAKLHRPWFAGGTITVASVSADRHYLAEGEAGFEDGTLNYLALPAVDLGLRYLEDLGVETIHDRVHSLTVWLIEELLSLKHGNGRPLVRLYGPASGERRGGTVTVNFYDANEEVIDHALVEKMASAALISLRTGCFCNPGAGEIALGLSRDELSSCFSRHARLTYDDFRMCIDGKSLGAVRISLGLVSNFKDVHRFLEFARGLSLA
jgi:selenocysteine lyase/cysteine desulfurase